MEGSIEPPEFASNPGATLHLWASGDAWTSFTAHSDPDHTYSGTLSLKTGGFEASLPCLGGVPFALRLRGLFVERTPAIDKGRLHV